MKKIGIFDVCKALTEDPNGDIIISLINENLVNLRKVKAGTQITIGVAGDLVAAIGLDNKFVGGLVLIDREQFFATLKRLEAEQE